MHAQYLFGRPDGDQLVLLEQPGCIPGRALRDALAILARDLHRTLDKYLPPGYSKVACVLSSLTVAAFLHEIGFPRAAVRPVILDIIGEGPNGYRRHLTVGATAEAEDKGDSIPMMPNLARSGWDGHMVVLVSDDTSSIMVDTTLSSHRRPEWPSLAGMIAFPAEGGDSSVTYAGRPLITSISADYPDETWLAKWHDDEANVSWKDGPDVCNPEITHRWTRGAAEMARTYRKQAGKPILRALERIVAPG